MVKCKYCLRPITKNVIAKKRAIKVQNALNSLAKAKANGNCAKMGRKKIRNDEQIRALRKTGLTMRAIAKKIGLSTTAVQRGLKP